LSKPADLSSWSQGFSLTHFPPKNTRKKQKKVLIFVHLRWPKLELRCHTYEESNKSYGTHHQNACLVEEEEEEEEAMSFSNTIKPFFVRSMDATNKS